MVICLVKAGISPRVKLLKEQIHDNMFYARAFDEGCLRCSNTLGYRTHEVKNVKGYRAHEVKNVEGTIKWENKGEILQGREDKKKKGKGKVPGILVVTQINQI